MTIRVDKKIEKFLAQSVTDGWNIIYSIPIGLKEVFTVNAKVTAIFEDQSRTVDFSLEGIFGNETGVAVSYGTVVKNTSEELMDIDCNFLVGVVRGEGETEKNLLMIQVDGDLARNIKWDGTLEITIRKDEIDYQSNPRLQLTIVGMSEAKKLGFAGLSDGINYVLVPTYYSTLQQGSNPIFTNESWALAYPKVLGGGSCSDFIGLSASRFGSSSAWTRWDSHAIIRWYTFTGDFGSGALTTRKFTVTYSSTGINGRLKNRVLSHSYTSPEGVVFLWGRLDVLGWGNYPIVL